MITIRNRQRKTDIDTKKIAWQAEQMIEVLGYKDFDLGILLTTNASIRKLNKQYRNKDKATDILSFPYHTELKPGSKIKVIDPEDKNLGDLIISIEYVIQDAEKTWGRSFNDHLTALLAHGIAHLLGYDHIIDSDYRLMRKIETKLLSTILTTSKS